MNAITVETQALIITAPQVADLRTLSATGEADSVLAAVELCGVCTPEQRVFRGALQRYPYWGGHELSAIILEDRSATASGPLAAGTRVAIGLMPRCGVCHACRRGLDNHCAYLHARPARPGELAGPAGFSSRVLVPRSMAFPFADEVPPEAAALAEPLACCLRSLRAGGAAPGDLVAIYGAGTMGRIHAALLVREGCRVLVFDDDPQAVAGARALGVAYAGPAVPEQVVEEVMTRSGGAGCVVAFCTRGGVRAIETAVQTSARGGTIVLYQTLPGSPPLALDTNDLHYRELRLVGSVAQTANDLQTSAALLSAWPDFHRTLSHETHPAPEGAHALERSLSPTVNRVFLDFRQFH